MSELPHHVRDYAQKIAQHEMGHYVVSRVLGFRTGDVTLKIMGPFLGHLGGAVTRLATSTNDIADVSAYIERRVQILYAGGQAQTLPPLLPHKTVDVQEAIKIVQGGQGAEQDHAKARELIHLLRGIRHPSTDPTDEVAVQAELTAIDVELWNKATVLVETHADAIVSLGRVLASRVKRVGVEVTLRESFLDGLPTVKALPVAA